MTTCLVVAVLAAAFAVQPVAAELEYVWIEAERPTSVPRLRPVEGKPDDRGFGFSAWGLAEVISGQVLTVGLSADEAQQRLPAEGAVFGYEFEIAAPGEYEIWNRIGYEWARSKFDWRIDDGPWQTILPTQPTEDVQLLQNWNELAWIKMGVQTLAAGKHRLEIRHAAHTQLDERRGEQVPARILFMSDCMVLTRGPFRPNGKFKPDDDYQDERDREAAATEYRLQLADDPAERSAVELTGLWQIARWDEPRVAPETRLQGPSRLPADLDQRFWYGIPVPGDRNALRPDLAYAHRYLYRTRVHIPSEAAGRALLLQMQNFNMIASVFVNRQWCGFSKAHSTEWHCDITRAVRPGRVNEIVVAMKDCYYAIDERERPEGTRYYWNLPHAWLHNQGVSMKFDMPVAWDDRTGLLEPVTLLAAGPAYTADVFCQPSVQRKELALEVTVKNPGAAAVKVRVDNAVWPLGDLRGGSAAVAPAERPAKTLPAREVELAPGEEKVLTLAQRWDDPRLWWPDDPQLYEVVTTLSIDGRPADVRRTRFGFREWQWDGLHLRLNGVDWPMWADCDYGPTPQEWVEKAKISGMRMIRYWRRDGWGGMTRRQVLDYMDEQGVPVRNSGVFDGEHASYGLTETVDGERRPRTALFENWKEQLAAWVRAERNHPSVFIWTIENEIVYINAHNFGNGPIVEPAIRDAAEMVMRLDPTRPVMVDGGRALRDQSLPVNGCHYNCESGVELRDYPDAAYTRDHWYVVPHRGAWLMAPDKPIFHGECFYANGWTPSKFAQLGGESCFTGMAETMPARGLFAKMVSEGWRWADVAAWHFWFGEADRSYYNAWQPVCVLCREWNWTFGGGERVERTLRVFNSTRHADPIEMAWHVTVDGKEVAGARQRFDVPPGKSQEVRVAFTLPQVRQRAAGEMVLTCARGGVEVFREVKPLAVIDPEAGPRPSLTAGQLVVLDPHGAAKARLAARGVPFTAVDAAEAIPASARVVIVGKDAVSEALATDPLWMRLALAGVKLLVLEQQHPLHYQAVPADLEPTDFRGRIAFIEDRSHPAFAGLDQPDFFTWSRDHVVYTHAYRKATRSARSLLQCDAELGFSALTECYVGDGLMLLCQAVVGEKLDGDPVARRLFDNLLAYAAQYRPVRKETAVVMDAGSSRGQLLASLGLKYDAVDDPLKALAAPYQIAVIDASPPHLARLAGNLDRVRAFTASGGWIMLWGVTPEGLADFNRIVGEEHLLRPFRMERVVLATPRDPLTAGLTLRDVVMEDSSRIASWMGLRWLSDNVFSHVVDLTDIAPFAAFPTPEEMGKGPDRRDPRSDHWPPNMVNGLTAEDSWRYCYSILLDDGHATRWTIELPRPEEVTNFSVVLNTIYHKVTRIHLYFDDDPEPFVIETRPTGGRQDFPVEGRSARRLTIELADWEESGRQNVIGIDNLWIGVRRSPQFLEKVRPLTNVGGLVRYNLGKGGVVLNQLHVPEQEPLPINAEKKAAITKTLLANLGGIFAGGRTVVPGADLRYQPIEIAEAQMNAYRNHGNNGWFRGPGDLSHLPLGEQTLAGVRYVLPDLKTSPVPNCVILRGSEPEETLAGIRVGRTADALFFLHAFEAAGHTQRWAPRRGEDPTPPAVFKYVIRYADGAAVEAPVRWREGVDHWLSESPKARKEAALAFSASFPGKEEESQRPAVYSMQWNNPRPDVPIETIDLVVVSENNRRWGHPALMAITAATALAPSAGR